VHFRRVVTGLPDLTDCGTVTFELPFGSGRLIGTGSRTGTPDIIGDFPRTGQVAWGNPFGNYFLAAALQGHGSRLWQRRGKSDSVLQQHCNRNRP